MTIPTYQEARERVDFSTCTMGVGCEEYGVCFAKSNGDPSRCDARALLAGPPTQHREGEGR